MTRATQFLGSSRFTMRATVLSVLAVSLSLGTLCAHAVNYPVTAEQRGTAQKVSEAGVPLSELAPNAPDSYRVKRGDTLWDISKLFLKSPWRWPELWGMNMDQIRNPHLIFPGQMLFLEKTNGRARLRVGAPVGDSGIEKLSPKVRTEAIGKDAIPTISRIAIEPFLNEAIVLQTNELDKQPRIVAAQENRVLLTRGDLAYVRGDIDPQISKYRVFREAKPLTDPTTNEVLGFEAAYVGVVDFVRAGESRVNAEGKPEIVPSTFTIGSVRQEVRVGDRLAQPVQPETENFVPRPPEKPLSGQVVSVYGEAIYAGQNQVIALNRGTRDGLERGNVLALWRGGRTIQDRTTPDNATLKLPEEQNGNVLVFRVFDRISYGLILSSTDSVKRGDRFSQP